jgi:HAMP domain-containing protein
MARNRNCLIALEDEDLARRSAERIRSWLPHLRVTHRRTPDLSGDYDLVLVGDRFANGPDVEALVASRWLERPDTPIVVVADDLDGDRMAALVNAGCSGTWDRAGSVPLERLRDRIVDALAGGGRRKGMLATVRSVRELVIEWNRLLESQEVTS